MVCLSHAVADEPARKPGRHLVATPIKSYRLLARSMGEEGTPFCGNAIGGLQRSSGEEVALRSAALNFSLTQH
jgi:hypothetical protein